MNHQDTQPTIATDADSYQYFLALCRAIGELVDAAESESGRDVVTVYIPHWFEAGGPWQLQRAGGPLEWRVARADALAAPGAELPATRTFAFRDGVASTAARMLAFDQANPFVLEQTSWCLA